MDLIAVKEGICTGCTACLYACPNACIRMERDREGFLYPVIDQEVCFNCNACNNICPAIKDKPKQKDVSVFAAIHSDDDIRYRSTSGGVFTALAKSTFDKGGVVFGAAFDEDFTVQHIRVDSVKDLKKLQGAKYTQSRLKSIFDDVETALSDGKPVIFSGTPCQVDGLNAVLTQSYDNLLTCAVVCHGVPSPGVFQKYLHFVRDKVGGNLKGIHFRRKQPSWRHYSMVIEGENGTEHMSPVSRNPYMKGFIEGLYMRPSCHQCPSKPSRADIILGDYWGVEHYHHELDDDRGTSLVILNTKKGKQHFDTVVKDLKIEDSDMENAIAHNPAPQFIWPSIPVS